MTFPRGIIHGGRVLSTRFDRVLRDPAAMWAKGRETRPRRLPVDLHVSHWTAGPAREGLDAGRRLFDAMEARKGEGGNDLTVSINFSVSWDGHVFQHLDLRTCAAVHVGRRDVYSRSLGTEFMWPGSTQQAKKLGYEHTPELRTWGGQRVECMPPSAAMLEAARWLFDAMCDLGEATDGEIDIPRIAAPRRRLSVAEMRVFKGFGEHGSMPGSTKVDAMGYMLDIIDGGTR
jgi:N-acetylmuramoyl-L-alanine amidase